MRPVPLTLGHKQWVFTTDTKFFFTPSINIIPVAFCHKDSAGVCYNKILWFSITVVYCRLLLSKSLKKNVKVHLHIFKLKGQLRSCHCWFRETAKQQQCICVRRDWVTDFNISHSVALQRFSVRQTGRAAKTVMSKIGKLLNCNQTTFTMCSRERGEFSKSLIRPQWHESAIKGFPSSYFLFIPSNYMWAAFNGLLKWPKWLIGWIKWPPQKKKNHNKQIL